MVQLRSKLSRECADVQPYKTTDGRVIPITIYGEFSKNTSGVGVPDHAWIECGGHIFETFPGRELQTEIANDMTRFCPQALRLTGSTADDYKIGMFDTFLTSAQAVDISRAFPEIFESITTIYPD